MREELIEEVVEENFNHDRDNRVTSSVASPTDEWLDVFVDASDSAENDDWHSGVLDASDIVAYSACAQGILGQLLIYPNGIRFVRTIKPKELWRFPFLALAEMKKTESASLPKLLLRSSQALELRFTDNVQTANQPPFPPESFTK
ncbi:MAG: hypothetical protein Q9222_000343 [Ikaeria aurantiellina]